MWLSRYLKMSQVFLKDSVNPFFKFSKCPCMICNDSNNQNSKSSREMVYDPKECCFEISFIRWSRVYLFENKLTQNWGIDRNLKLLIFSVVIKNVKLNKVSFLHFNNTIRRQKIPNNHKTNRFLRLSFFPNLSKNQTKINTKDCLNDIFTRNKLR